MRFFMMGLALIPFVASANTLTLDDALRATYTACVGIDDEISHLKTMAGINTAVTAVGTAAGAGAIATGFVKQKTDHEITDIEARLQQLINSQQSQEPLILADREQFLEQAKKILESYTGDDKQTQQNDFDKLDGLNEQSKKLGNWRTGLLAANTATNIAGAAIAGTNKVDAELDEQIKNCVTAVDNLRNSMMQARLDGVDITEAQSIADACGDYATVDASKINKRATGAMASSAVGAATGLAGTAVSAAANSKETRNAQGDAAQQREKNLNTAANALSIGATAASVTATVFNATQIAAIKKVAAVSEKCTGVLK